DQDLADFARTPMRLIPLEGNDQALDLLGQLVGITHRPAEAVERVGLAKGTPLSVGTGDSVRLFLRGNVVTRAPHQSRVQRSPSTIIKQTHGATLDYSPADNLQILRSRQTRKTVATRPISLSTRLHRTSQRRLICLASTLSPVADQARKDR